MSNTRFSRGQKAVALVPLALLSTAWTASLVGVGGSAVAISADENKLPDGATVPAEAFDEPANYSRPGSVGLVPEEQGDSIVRTSSTNGIPSAALAGYQRAATVINSADKSCGLDWQLLAAIGRVESDHGRYDNNTLGTDGVSRPGIFGIPLDGSNDTREIRDTDAGQFDNDEIYDRAVGPMQFIPTTWASVGVDADGDGKRNPQDIDDAALASAVYLCAGSDDLSTDQGRRTAVHRYNNSDKYVDLVLRIRDAYLEGDYTSVPNNTTSAINFTPDYALASPNLGSQLATRPPKATSPVRQAPGSEPSTSPSPSTPGASETPSTPGTDKPASPGKKAQEAAKEATKPLRDALDPVVDGVVKPVDNLITKTLAQTLCVPAIAIGKYQECVAKLTGQPNEGGIITAILRSLGLAN